MNRQLRPSQNSCICSKTNFNWLIVGTGFWLGLSDLKVLKTNACRSKHFVLYGCDIKCGIVDGARIFLQPTLYETVLLSYFNFVGVCVFFLLLTLYPWLGKCVCVFFFFFSKASGRTWACGRTTGTNNTNYISVDKHMEIAGCEIDFRLWN